VIAGEEHRTGAADGGAVGALPAGEPSRHLIQTREGTGRAKGAPGARGDRRPGGSVGSGKITQKTDELFRP
jgi:hypothetical protein